MLSREERAEWVRRGYKDPRTAFANHIHSAATRGIPFKLTFDEWWDLWKDKYAQRGIHKGQYVMCRHGDRGGYEVGNVRIATATENHHERCLEHRTAKGQPGMGRKSHEPPSNDSWLWRRDVFAEYTEDEESA